MSSFLNYVHRQFADRPDTEHEQAIVRLIIAVLILSYFFVLRLGDGGADAMLQWPLMILLCESIIGLGLVIGIAINPRSSKPRRLVGMLADYLTLGGLMSFGGASLAPLYVIYMWVTVGNGLRYGHRYLHASVAMAAASFLVVIQLTPYWIENRSLAWGLLLGLVAIPAYLTSLLKALTSARDEARRANTAKSHFLATMSHEFRTPLNGIVSASALLASTPLSVEQRENFDILQASAHSLLALVEDVLDISKIEAGKLQKVDSDFSLAGLMHNVELVLMPAAKKKELAFNIQIDEDVPAYLHGDQNHLRQVVMNLVSNAIKFTDHGSVLVTVRKLDTAVKGNVNLSFSVRDSGIGIAQAAQSRIFDAFEQADQGRSRRYGGTGLGTTIAKSLVELMGGSIAMESTEGVGSHFWFSVGFKPAATNIDAVAWASASLQEATVEVPELQELAAASAVVSAADRFRLRVVSSNEMPARIFDIDDPFIRYRALGLGPMEILVADDQPANLAILCRVLEKAGHRFHQVQSGEGVLNAIENGSYDCAIIDLHMPGSSGLDIIRQARVMQSGLRQTPFVILTADATAESANDCKRAGARAFLTKPIMVTHLLDTLRDIAIENAAAAAAKVADKLVPTAIDLISMSAVQELRRLGLGDDFLKLFISECQVDAGRCIAAMEQMVPESDWDGLREQCHALKGVAVNMAAVRLAGDATALMQLEPDAMRRESRKRIKGLQWCLEATRIALLETMAPRPAAQMDRLGTIT
ncbi:MAG: ATP-binding protein [Dokdonella sp.]